MYQSPYVIKRPANSVSKRRSSNVSNWICFYKNLPYFIETNYPDESIQESLTLLKPLARYAYSFSCQDEIQVRHLCHVLPLLGQSEGHANTNRYGANMSPWRISLMHK